MIKTKRLSFLISLLLATGSMHAQEKAGVITQTSPSRAEYFSWINNTNEGANEKQTLINLDFFRWLQNTYGMKIDIYAFDAGAIDGANIYGNTYDARFKRHFPNGFDAVAKSAASIGARLGVWCGPDGFGDTEEEANKRIDMMSELVEKYNFGLFKMDGVCGQLRNTKYDYFDKMMTRIRKTSPDFILLNHRLDLGPGTKHSTTFLLGGAETYIDVLMTNSMTAPHHRGEAISRQTPDKLNRLTEDHGVCLSSCLDYWEDDIVLQAFGRELILAPELYGNPWLLRDDEFPQLAFFFNLHRQYRDILVNGVKLPENKYGPEALSRGDGNTRFLTLRNLTWNPVTYHINLGKEIGLESNNSKVKARLYHPYIFDMGNHAYGSTIDVEVQPFRSALVKVTNVKEKDKIALSGIPYNIVNDYSGNPTVKLLGMPGMSYKMKVERGNVAYKSSDIDGKSVGAAKGSTVTVKFPGEKLTLPYFRHISDMQQCEIPNDASAIYYATCYAADNNALEVRSLERSGETKIPQVKAARDAFFNQKVFREREIWDKYLFDGDKSTAFSVAVRWNDHSSDGSTAFMVDMGKEQALDQITIDCPDEYSITPYKSEEGARLNVSADLVNWKSIPFYVGPHAEIDVSKAGKFRYMKLDRTPLRVSEVAASVGGKQVDRSNWRASNLFRNYNGAKHAWSSSFTLDEIPEKAYLCIAINGECGTEGAWAGIKVDGKYVGCPDRAPSFTANTWEFRVQTVNKNYTYYVPLTPDMKGKTIEAYAFSFGTSELKPQIWLNTYPIPFKQKTLTLHK